DKTRICIALFCHSERQRRIFFVSRRFVFPAMQPKGLKPAILRKPEIEQNRHFKSPHPLARELPLHPQGEPWAACFISFSIIPAEPDTSIINYKLLIINPETPETPSAGRTAL
ncbi:MAG: hypothetical protein II727_10340, partial [Oscillospiraceae bacterium]|nr:hypothetical protein [Oscillospiraceae bacterium]